ncbi:MAG: ATP-binding protein [Candidatus Hydrogenedentes bacterium]|nr:ATP-binding protein [Candidatus Hydrogenedentota bacterium]
MIRRQLEKNIHDTLGNFPVVALLGGRQVGKTTLAKMIREALPNASIYLDLERPTDLAKLQNPESYLEMHADKTVILDEIQRIPELFPVLRALVDDGQRNGRFLVLGSASPDLIRQSSESLSGRIRYIELGPLALGEIEPTPENTRKLWLRGGYPDSYLAASDSQSAQWREAFIKTYLERDLPALGIRIPATMLDRFWRMVAHSHGQLWNGNKIAAGLGVSNPTTKHYLDVLADTFIVRQLRPYHANLKKRLVKAPKVYLRDSGMLHALLQLENIEDLLGHPTVGPSWEGWVIEQILALAPDNWRPWFYRTHGGAEIDLLLERPGRKAPLAFEIKRASAPTVSKGFWTALRDLGLDAGYVVYPCDEAYPLDNGVSTLPVGALPQFMASLKDEEDTM